jgi:hypothetical protein
VIEAQLHRHTQLLARTGRVGVRLVEAVQQRRERLGKRLVALTSPASASSGRRTLGRLTDKSRSGNGCADDVAGLAVFPQISLVGADLADALRRIALAT